MRSRQELAARSNLAKDPNLLHDLVKKITKKSSRIGPLKSKEAKETITDAEILARQYSKVFTTPHRSNMFNDPDIFFNEDDIYTPSEEIEALKEFNINVDLIKQAIDSLPSKSCSLDPMGFQTYSSSNLNMNLLQSS